MGYNIFLDGKRVAFTPLTRWTSVDWPKLKSGTYTVSALDLQDNESAASTGVRFDGN